MTENSKIMVVNGATGPGLSARNVEIIDIRSNQSTICNLPDFPEPNVASVGGLVNQTVPMVCGGSNPQTNTCYYLVNGVWQKGSKITLFIYCSIIRGFFLRAVNCLC